jgi:hypothetical protein
MTSVRELKMMVELGNRQAKVNNELLGWIGTSTNSAQQNSLLIEDRDPEDLIEDLTGEDLDYDIEHDMTAQTEIEDALEKVMEGLIPQLEKSAYASAVRNNPYMYQGKPLYYPVAMLGRAGAVLTIIESSQNNDREDFNTAFEETILPDTMEEMIVAEREKQRRILAGLYKEKRINEAKALNIGERSTAQYPNESNEDYVARIAMINQSLPDKAKNCSWTLPSQSSATSPASFLPIQLQKPREKWPRLWPFRL